MKHNKNDFESAYVIKRKKTNLDAAYTMYADMLYRLALSHSSSEEDAQDAVHDAFAAFLTADPHFEDTEHEKAWFIRVTINKCRDISRKNAVRVYTDLEEIGEIAISDEKENPAILALRLLHEKYRAVIVLHYLEGYSVEETAHILNLSLSAVKMRLSRGRLKLREIIEKEELL